MSGAECAGRLQNCLHSRCCVSSNDGCYKRSIQSYAQCRPLASPCTFNGDWICPESWMRPLTPDEACRATWLENGHGKRMGKFNELTQPVLMVHIGKTGGSTVAGLLRRTRILFDEIHLSRTPESLIMSHPKVIVPVRDPVARFISAWNYAKNGLSPTREREVMRGIQKWNMRGSNFSQDSLGIPTDLWGYEVYGCFVDVRALADGLEQSDLCGRLARQLLVQPPPVHLNHLTMGFCYYLGGLIDLLAVHQAWVIRLEVMKADVLGMLTWLYGERAAGTPRLGGQGATELHNKVTLSTLGSLCYHCANASSKSPVNPPLSVTGEARLREALQGEYNMVNQLIRLAINLPNGTDEY